MRTVCQGAANGARTRSLATPIYDALRVRARHLPFAETASREKQRTASRLPTTHSMIQYDRLQAHLLSVIGTLFQASPSRTRRSHAIVSVIMRATLHPQRLAAVSLYSPDSISLSYPNHLGWAGRHAHTRSMDGALVWDVSVAVCV